MPKSVVGRFAPSPTGSLHLGSLFAAVGSFLYARAAGGRWLVRMEDLDPPREQAGAAQAILDTLSAHGLDWDGEVCWQSRRTVYYDAALQALSDRDMVFACGCSRQDLGEHGVHHEPCKRPADKRRNHALRLRVPAVEIAVDDKLQGRFTQNMATEVGDVVLRRRDGYYAYQLAVVVDDAQQGITEVVRGADLLDSTPRQILLQRSLELWTPSYAHLPVLLDAEGLKLSKSRLSPEIDATRACQQLRRTLELLGQMDAAGSTPSAILANALSNFVPSRLPTVPSISV